MIRLACNLNPFFRNACVSAYCNWWWRRCHTIWTKWRGIWIRGFKYDGWWPVSLHVHLFCKSRMNVLFKRRFAKFLCLFTSPSVTFKPCSDCSGLQMVNFTMYEVQTFPDIVPKNSTATLYITIQEVNDPPTMFVSRFGKLIQHADPTEPIVVRHLWKLCLENSYLRIEDFFII